jgi:hypothetical protein
LGSTKTFSMPMKPSATVSFFSSTMSHLRYDLKS